MHDDPAGWDDKQRHFTGSPRHVVHANPPRVGRPGPMGPFSEHLGLSFPAFRSSCSPRPRGEGSERNRTTKRGILHVSSLAPWARRDRRPRQSVSTRLCLPRDFISWNRAPPSQTLVPIAWDHVENPHHALDRLKIGGLLAFVSTARRGHDGMVESGPDRAVG